MFYPDLKISPYSHSKAMIVRAVMQVEQTQVDLRLAMKKRTKTGMPKIMTMNIHLFYITVQSNPVLSQLSPEKITNYTANFSPFRKAFYTISFFSVTHRIMDSQPI